MGTPFIQLLEPSKLDGYRRGILREEQSPKIPSTFLDAMEVREAVFINEQSVPADNEFDDDDTRSCHWVAYASINTVVEHEIRDDANNIITPRRSVTRTTPIGTIRLVPFPHPRHPKAGTSYYGGKAIAEDGTQLTLEVEDDRRASTALGISYIIEEPTSFHDGQEPYVKLGRLAVVEEFRGHRIGHLLVRTVVEWLGQNPTYFDPSVRSLGLELLGATDLVIPRWNGLICVHAQEQVAGFWERNGFKIDEGMGRWSEEGIQHVGMFQRLEIGEGRSVIKSGE